MGLFTLIDNVVAMLRDGSWRDELEDWREDLEDCRRINRDFAADLNVAPRTPTSSSPTGFARC